jgi:hypothetical protein
MLFSNPLSIIWIEDDREYFAEKLFETGGGKVIKFFEKLYIQEPKIL